MTKSPRNAVQALNPSGVGAISRLLLSGPDLEDLVKQSFRPHKGQDLEALFDHPDLYLGSWQSSGILIDEILLEWRGDDCLLNCHGGQGVFKALRAQFDDWGFRWCQPGEFLELKSQLLEAEGEAFFVKAQGRKALSVAIEAMSGALSGHLQSLIETESEHKRSLIFDRLEEGYRYGSQLYHGLSVAFAGPPNVGKSTLVNHLLGKNRALTGDIQGLTRDVLRSPCVWEDWPLVLWDCPGLWSSEGLAGDVVKRSQEAFGQSDIKIACDAPELEADIHLNLRCDLQMVSDHGMPVSVFEKRGIDDLKAAILKHCPEPVPGPVLFHPRHKECLALGRQQALANLLQSLRHG